MPLDCIISTDNQDTGLTLPHAFQLEKYCLLDEIIRYIRIIPISALCLYTYQLDNYCLSDAIL
jgi:hypothetical protein